MREDSARSAGAADPRGGETRGIGLAWLAPPAIAALAATAMLITAAALNLPIRDPDARYVGSPLALIGLIALVFLIIDVVSHAWIERRREHRRRPLRKVLRERWWGKRGVIVFVALLSFYATYLSYRNLKSYIPFATEADHDLALLDLERTLFFGQDPAAILHWVLGTDVAAHVLSVAYLAFLSFVPLSLGAALIWSSNLRAGLWYVTALSINWVFGAASYYVLPSQGPVYAEPRLFAGLPETGVSRLQDTLSEHRHEVLADPFATGAVQSVAAFASLHVAVVFSAALIAQLLGVRKAIRIGLWTFLGLTLLSTVYFGWHYLIDDVAGLGIGVAAVYLAGRLTGYELSPARTLAHSSARAA